MIFEFVIFTVVLRKNFFYNVRGLYAGSVAGWSPERQVPEWDR
jgi:hypothetical protein